jgi:Uncharacterized conserved protein
VRSHALLDHTGDVGFVARAESVEGVFEESAKALFAVILDDVERVRSESALPVEIGEAVDREDLLVRFLGELLFLHDAKDWVFCGARVAFLSSIALRGEALGERFDPAQHRIARQVKAVTYHHLLLSEDRGGWSARVVLDL